MIIELAITAALAAPAAELPPPPMEPVQGVVMYMEHKPGCNLLNLAVEGKWFRQNVCVSPEAYAEMYWLAWFDGLGRAAT